MTRRKSIFGAAVLLLLLVIGGILSSAAPGGDNGPQGARALRKFLQGMGMVVVSGHGSPKHGTLLLLHDLRSRDQAALILRWIEKGGRLVLADPESAIAEELGVSNLSVISPSDESTLLHSGCALKETAGVRKIAVGGYDSAFRAASGAVDCFRTPKGPFLISARYGAGRVIILGGPSPLTNEFLSVADNSVFAFRLFDSYGPVTFGTPLPLEENDKSIWAMLPSGARSAIIQMAVAMLIFAFFRGRRFGKPVIEEPLSVIPSAELVKAAGSLYRRARETSFAGRLLRTAFLARMGRRFGVPTNETETLGEFLSTDNVVDAAFVRSTLQGPDPKTDEELIVLSQNLEEIEQRIMSKW